MSGARVWTRVWCLAAACGVGLAGLAWSPVVALVATLLLSCGAGLVTLVVWSVTDQLPPHGHVPWRRLVPRALAGGAGLVSFFVLAGASSSLALLCLLLCALTWPPLLRRIARGTGAPPPPPARPRPDPDHPLTELDDEALCRLWRHTYWQLELEATEAGVLDLVAQRQACLDELERRDPTALQAWLSSGARPSSGPERFWPHGDEPGGADAA